MYLFIYSAVKEKKKESPPYPCNDWMQQEGGGAVKLEMGNEIKWYSQMILNMSHIFWSFKVKRSAQLQNI